MVPELGGGGGGENFNHYKQKGISDSNSLFLTSK
jgi:hypothetical protein